MSAANICRGLFALIAVFCAANHAAAGSASISPFSTVEYRLSSESAQSYAESGRRFAEEVQAIGARTKSLAQRPTAYLELGKVFEKYLGHHYLSFRFYDKALSLAGVLPAKKRPAFVAEAKSRIEGLAMKRFMAVSELVYGDGPVIDPALVVIPKTVRREGVFPELEDIDHGKFLVAGNYCARNPRWPGDALQWRAAPEAPACWHRLGWIQALLIRLPEHAVYYTQRPYQVSGGWLMPLEIEKSLEREAFEIVSWKFEPESKGGLPYTKAAKLQLLLGLVERFPELQGPARPVLDDALYAYAKEQNTIELWRRYLSSFPDGKHREEISREVERHAFESAREAGRAAIETFLQSYPASTYRKPALERIEFYDFEEAKAKSSVAALESHLDRYPDGTTQDATRQELDRLRFAAARQDGALSAYRSFIERYPESRYLDEARRAILAIESGEDFAKVRQVNTVAAYAAFLNRYPSSPFALEAGARLAFLRARGSAALSDCEEFLRLYHQVESPVGLREEHTAVVAILVSQAAAEAAVVSEGAAAHILAHRETGDPELLQSAWGLVNNSQDELYILQHFDDRSRQAAFRLVPTWDGSDPKVSQDISWPLANPIIKSQPRIRAAAFSQARKGSYRVTFEMTMKVDYEKYFYGIAWFDPQDGDQRWSETYRATAVAEVPAQGRSALMDFDFPGFELARRKGLPAVYSYETVGTPGETSYRVIKVEPAH